MSWKAEIVRRNEYGEGFDYRLAEVVASSDIHIAYLVACKPSTAKLIAANPDLLEVAEMVLKAANCADPADKLACLAAVAELAKDAIAKAKR